jgi:hypothetical protein
MSRGEIHLSLIKNVIGTVKAYASKKAGTNAPLSASLLRDALVRLQVSWLTWQTLPHRWHTVLPGYIVRSCGMQQGGDAQRTCLQAPVTWR